MSDLVVIIRKFEVANNQVTTSSLSVTKIFNKNHKNIIRKINEFPKDNGTQLNFEPSKYTDSMGRKLKAYNITRDGFVMLAMGFTGHKVYRFKVV